MIDNWEEDDDEWDFFQELEERHKARKRYCQFIAENKMEQFDKPAFTEICWIPQNELKVFAIVRDITLKQARELRDTFSELCWDIYSNDPAWTNRYLKRKALTYCPN